ncbi:MAG: dephospho-CoA kinase [bacterium]|nr:dephospho-CoA kinase [bacterium]
MRVIGLTGGIATGKSTVARLLQDQGAELIDADVLAREVVEPGQPALEEIRAVFGERALDAEGRLDRPWLARTIFADPALRRCLEEILHPRVRERARQRLAALAAHESSPGLVVWVVPLLFETGLHEQLDEVWVVAVSPETQVARLMARDGLDEAEARRRIAAQWPMERKLELADRVIDNDGSPGDLLPQVLQALEAGPVRGRRG